MGSQAHILWESEMRKQEWPLCTKDGKQEAPLGAFILGLAWEGKWRSKKARGPPPRMARPMVGLTAHGR